MDSTAPAPPATQPSTSRRRFLYGGTAVVAAAAGSGLAWWRYTPSASSGALVTLWASSFETPQGAPLVMGAFRGKPLLINFWATWCPPCIEELPLIDSFYRQHAAKSWQVLGLAIDRPSAVRTFLARTPVSFPVGMAGLGGTELGAALGNASGGLPFTVVVSAGGELLHRKMGRLTPTDLANWSKTS